MFVSTVLFRGSFGVKGAINDASIFKNLLQKCILRNFTGVRLWTKNSRTFFSSSQKRISVSRFSKLAESTGKNFEISTAVLNNVLIFKYERSTAFKFIMAFAVVQLFGMYSMSINVYNTFCQDLFNPDLPWMTRLMDHKFSVFTICAAAIFSPIISLITYVVAARTVRRVILHKGGQAVTIVTYHPIPNMSRFTVPLENVSCRASRHKRGTLPISIKNRRFYYFVDNDGEFLNGDLFDFTVGIKRNLK